MSAMTEHELQAYVDGELAPDDVARVEAAIAGDPALAAQVERERRLRAQLRAAFDPVLDEPVPARFAALLQGGTDRAGDAGLSSAAPSAPEEAAHGRGEPDGTVVPLRTGKARATRPRWHTPVYALAASVTALAMSLWLRPEAGPVRMQDGEFVARGELARGLDTALASEPRGDAALAIGLSFRDGDGRVCRSFIQRGEPALAGLACREGDRWTLPVLTRAGARDEGELRQAASGVPAEVQAAVDARLEGDVFDAQDERAAREAGWR
jgi:hypothetical protein